MNQVGDGHHQFKLDHQEKLLATQLHKWLEALAKAEVVLGCLQHGRKKTDINSIGRKT